MHWHILAVDGVFSASAQGDGVAFTETRAPAASEVTELARRCHDRVLRLLRRRGLLRELPDDEPSQHAPIDACAQLSLRLGKLGYVDERGVVHEPDVSGGVTTSHHDIEAQRGPQRHVDLTAPAGAQQPQRVTVIGRSRAPQRGACDFEFSIGALRMVLEVILAEARYCLYTGGPPNERSTRGPKKPVPKRTRFANKAHVSTARLLAESRRESP